MNIPNGIFGWRMIEKLKWHWEKNYQDNFKKIKIKLCSQQCFIFQFRVHCLSAAKLKFNFSSLQYNKYSLFSALFDYAFHVFHVPKQQTTFVLKNIKYIKTKSIQSKKKISGNIENNRTFPNCDLGVLENLLEDDLHASVFWLFCRLDCWINFGATSGNLFAGILGDLIDFATILNKLHDCLSKAWLWLQIHLIWQSLYLQHSANNLFISANRKNFGNVCGFNLKSVCHIEKNCWK